MSSPPEVVRQVEICAQRETVFRFFTDSARFARWWGEGSHVDPRPGGALYVRHPDGSIASGVFKEIVPPQRVVFTYGFEGPHQPIAPGGSTVTVTFEETPRGTRVTLRHAGLPSEELARHYVQGWRYQLSLYAKVATAEQNAGAAAIADQWFAAWNEKDAARRRELLAACSMPEVAFFDDFSVLAGLDDLDAQIAAVHRFMPGMTIARVGEPLHCQGSGLIRWEARDAQGNVKFSGLNAVQFAPDGRIARATGFWGA
jgi:uncharacterized protein YndB with AHSA1/START domain